jgi:hypothetical protein
MIGWLMNVENLVEWKLAGETEVLWGNLPQCQFCSPQIPHDLNWVTQRKCVIGKHAQQVRAMCSIGTVILSSYIVMYSGCAWLITMGSGLDDWIYCLWYLQSIITAHTQWLSTARSVPYWTMSVFSSTVTNDERRLTAHWNLLSLLTYPPL